MNDLYIQGVHIDWNKIPVNSYLREIDAIKGLEELIFHNSITFFVGENGSGKSTLLEALAVACGFNPEGGTKNYIFSTYDSHSQLHEAIRVVKGYRQAKWGYFLRAESFYNVATKEEEYADWEHPSEKYHEKSHGESFLALAQNYLKPNGVYLSPIPSVIQGKRVVLIDDSIVRGTTSRQLVSLLREAGAKEIHLRISAPPFLHPCYYGTDIDSEENLIASHHGEKEVATLIGADSLGYLPLECLHELTGTHSYCDACFSGKYATEIPTDVRKDRFEQKLSER